MIRILSTCCFLAILGNYSLAQSKFAQLGTELPTPNEYRNAAGAPGHNYYQQKADYKINITLDDEKQIIYGEEIITYTNNSPDQLSYLWLQLDQNFFRENSDSKAIRIEKMENFKAIGDIKYRLNQFEGGFNIDYVKATNGQAMKFFINKTMMRIDLDKPLGAKQSISFSIKWWHNINDRFKVGGRSGMEYFKEDDNYLYTIAQFFPRMCVYNDVEGWQNKQFLGTGEFSLPFGDYLVNITVPEDHIVTGTGELQNGAAILTADQRNRLKKATTSDTPIMIVTQEEAEKAEKDKKKKTKTWQFKATNVRDFAFASSRKFIWDAMNVTIAGKNILAMSFYPKEGNPLWEKYSTKLIAHTLTTYSKYTVDYPYPVAISVHSKEIGMEYPMISFNGGRPEKDGTYSEETKYGMWGVIIHEVGHNFFPMIINSDERQWSWMDEGLNTFVQYLTEQEWERDYPSRRGPAHMITDYMRGDQRYITPIMTNSESIYQFGNNAYGKPATALNILRETIMGRELFDYAFKVYCERWKFKHPTPADFFRTMEDASAVDLDWFWRGWFFSTDYVDLSLDEVKYKQLTAEDPAIVKANKQAIDVQKQQHISSIRNRQNIQQTYNEKDTLIDDFYRKRNPYQADKIDEKDFNKRMEYLSDEEREILSKGYHFYELKISNKGGLVSPVILKFTFKDETEKIVYIPAEIWKMDDIQVSKIFYFEKEISSILLDPYLETADCDVDNNAWPTQSQPSRFQVFQQEKVKENPMQRQKRIENMND